MTLPQRLARLTGVNGFSWISVCLLILGVSAIRFRLLDIPLERDEGEYAYIAQLMLQGIPPYKAAWNFKLPGIYTAYAVIMGAFGQTIAGIHFGLLVVNAISMLLVFLLARRLFGVLAGMVACASYGLLAVSSGVLGTAGHATQFIVPLALGGILLLWRAWESERARDVFFGGLLLGTAILMKQHAAFFALFGGIYLLRYRKFWRTVPLYVLAVILPWAFTCLALWRAGVFDRFWFWTVTYARAYVTELPWSSAPSQFIAGAWPVVLPNVLIWLIAGVGLLLAFWAAPQRRAVNFTAALLGFSLLAISPGFFYRDHYFVMLLPAAALLAGACVSVSRKFLGPTLPPVLFALAVLYCLMGQRYFLFLLSPVEVSRAVYGANPFPEAMEVGNYLRAHTSPSARIAVLGSEPEIYFYAGRRSASGHIYTDHMMRPHPYALMMQQEFVHDIEEARPEYVVFVTVPTSWLRTPRSVPMIFEWWKQFAPQHYSEVGIADIISADQTEYRWDQAVASYRPRSSQLLLVMRRMDQTTTSIPGAPKRLIPSSSPPVLQPVPDDTASDSLANSVDAGMPAIASDPVTADDSSHPRRP